MSSTDMERTNGWATDGVNGWATDKRMAATDNQPTSQLTNIAHALRVSVVIPVRNGGVRFRGCLDAIRTCDPPPFAVIVGDDAAPAAPGRSGRADFSVAVQEPLSSFRASIGAGGSLDVLGRLRRDPARRVPVGGW